MSRNIVSLSGTGSAARRHSAAVVKQIRFAPQAPAGAEVLRSFRSPRACVAWEALIDFSVLAGEPGESAAADQFTVVLLAPDTPLEARSVAEKWITAAGFDSPITVSLGGHKVQWRHGKAVAQAPADGFEGIVAALTDFAFYESELRGLEHDLEDRENLAPADVSRAYHIRRRDRGEWNRIRDTIESLYRMRLKYARLESSLAKASLAASRESRPLLERLIEESAVNDRLEAFSNALEACEDLYEGAHDRIMDHRWYLEGQWLEAGIIALLLIEIVLMTTDLYLKHVK